MTAGSLFTILLSRAQKSLQAAVEEAGNMEATIKQSVCGKPAPPQYGSSKK